MNKALLSQHKHTPGTNKEYIIVFYPTILPIDQASDKNIHNYKADLACTMQASIVKKIFFEIINGFKNKCTLF